MSTYRPMSSRLMARDSRFMKSKLSSCCFARFTSSCTEKGAERQSIDNQSTPLAQSEQLIQRQKIPRFTFFLPPESPQATEVLKTFKTLERRSKWTAYLAVHCSSSNGKLTSTTQCELNPLRSDHVSQHNCSLRSARSPQNKFIHTVHTRDDATGAAKVPRRESDKLLRGLRVLSGEYFSERSTTSPRLNQPMDLPHNQCSVAKASCEAAKSSLQNKLSCKVLHACAPQHLR